MKPFTRFSRCLLLAALCGPAYAAVAASPVLPRSAPEEQGVSSSALLAFIEAADQQIDGLNSVMLLRHGRVIAEGWWAPYKAQTRHELYSLSKSFTSTAVGLAVADGKLSIDDPVLKFFPDDAPAEPSANLKAMRVRDLLCMSTGHQDEPSSAPDKISPSSFLAHPVPHKPGTHFRYNTAATFMLSAIVQKQTGQSILDYLQPRLFEPLGIEHPTWNTNFQGISLGGYGLSVRSEDIARFGQLYLQKGEWQGKRLIPSSWVDMATSRQTSNGSNPNSDWDQGYGFQFWRCRHGAYRGDGAFGQYCLVLPEQDAVLAITAGLKDMQAVLNLVWDKLLPAFESSRLQANTEMHQQLQRKLSSLTLRTPTGAASSPLADKVRGRKFVFPENDQKLESLALLPQESGKSATLVMRSNGVENRFECGSGVWKDGTGSFGTIVEQPCASSGAWTGEDTYVVKRSFYQTPYCLTLKLRFAGEQVFCDFETNVGFGSTKKPQLVGQASGQSAAGGQ